MSKCGISARRQEYDCSLGPNSRASQVSLYVEELGFIYALILIYLKVRGIGKSGDVELCCRHSLGGRLVSRLLRFLLRVSGFRLTGLGEGDSVPEYPHLHARAMELTAELTKVLIPVFQTDVYYQRLQALLEDPDSASSYVGKYVARYTLFPVVREILVWRQSRLNQDPRPRMVFVMPLGWPTEWCPAIREHLLGDGIEVFSARLSRLISFAFKLWLVMVFTLSLGKRALSNGVGSTKIGDGKTYRMIREFIDPRALGGRAQDNDYLVDSERLHPEEVLFYVTPLQDRNHLAKLGSKEHILNALKPKGYSAIYLSELKLPAAMLWGLLRFIIQSSLKLFSCLSGWRAIGGALISGFQEYLVYAPFFQQVRGQVHLSFTLPQGWTGWRSNNGLLTALCRQHSIFSASYQTRAYWCHDHEYGFEALDLLLMWGPAWKDFLDPYLMYVKRVEYIGDIFVDDLVSATRANGGQPKEPGGHAGINIGLLTGDITHMHTVSYNMRLLNTACRIALKHPEVKLIIKPKDPDHWDVFLSDKQFLTYTQALGERLAVTGDPRHYTERVILTSDILLAIGFTTPGTDALLLGKRVIYYDEIGCADDLYGRVPKLVAKSPEEMERLVDEALASTEDYHRTYSRQLDEFDPYRDGHASRRIYSLLFPLSHIKTERY